MNKSNHICIPRSIDKLTVAISKSYVSCLHVIVRNVVSIMIKLSMLTVNEMMETLSFVIKLAKTKNRLCSMIQRRRVSSEPRIGRH